MKAVLLLLLTFSLFANAWEGHQEPPPEDPNEFYDPLLLDLNTMASDFCLGTKEIIIPEFPLAFNPAIIKWRNSTLLSFRVRDERGISTFQIGLVLLDKHFNPKGTPQILEIPLVYPGSFLKFQDPRLIDIAGHLYIVYSNIIDRAPGERELRRMFYAEVLFDGTTFSAINPTCLTNFEGESNQRWEKNWAPFNYRGTLLFTYGLLPHQILFHNPETNSCDTVASSLSNIDWEWGTLRGGTPPLLDSGLYLAFFHTCKNMVSAQSKGKNITHYFMGAYTFSPEPPFNITQISPAPIIYKDFYTGPPHNTWKPLRVIFPCGYIADKNYIYLAYGRQDHECWIAKLDKKKLLKSLVPVSLN